MGDICAKILAHDDIPPLSKLLIKFPLNDPGNLAILLSLEHIGHISDLFNRRIGDANNSALVLWLQV